MQRKPVVPIFHDGTMIVCDWYFLLIAQPAQMIQKPEATIHGIKEPVQVGADNAAILCYSPILHGRIITGSQE